MSGIRVLFVEGPSALSRRLEPDLRACARSAHVEGVTSVSELERALERGPWDAIVVAPGAASDAAEVTQLARARQPGVPVLTGSASALSRSLRRLRRTLEGRRAELARTREELHERESQLLHAQKMEIIGNFAGGIAHDFNNIVMSMGGYAAMLLQDWPAGHAGREDMEEIVRSAEQAQALTRQLLGFARKEMHQPRRIELPEVVRSVDQLLRHSAGSAVRIDLNLDESTAVVRGDASQIQQVLLNLVLNARDAMPGGGAVTIDLANVELTSGIDGVNGPIPAGEWVRLAVADQGVGMDDETRRRALEPFFTTKPVGRGTGLGLAIVHDIVRRSDSHLRLTSAPNAGSTFEIFFPPDAGPASNSDGHGQAVLLVEDEPSLVVLVRRMLERAGYHVLVAGDAERALDVARSHSGPLHLLLTDVVLPGRNGCELADAMAALRPGLPTLFMSGYGDGVVERAGLDMARARILDKPFSVEDLYACVREAIAAGAGAKA